MALGLEFAAAGSNELGFLKTTMRLVIIDRAMTTVTRDQPRGH